MTVEVVEEGIADEPLFLCFCFFFNLRLRELVSLKQDISIRGAKSKMRGGRGGEGYPNTPLSTPGCIEQTFVLQQRNLTTKLKASCTNVKDHQIVRSTYKVRLPSPRGKRGPYAVG